ncbi:hypothetical protein [Aeromonas veronii]|uniref:hypothetical protein n=1 Tax=Aeromonas veronii TaxID=654 RepID=UPI002B493F61|nr:hypothetical protein [Aeromonas veronii]
MKNNIKALTLGIATLPILVMLTLLVVGYALMGLRIEPLLLLSAVFTALLALWQGYSWDEIMHSIVQKLAKAMPVILILVCVGGANR